MEGVAFNDERSIAAHEGGRVDAGGADLAGEDDAEGEMEGTWGGLYAAGWFKRGPSGIVGTNIACAKDTVATIITDFQATPRRSRAGAPGVHEGLFGGARGKCVVVDWEGHLAIDAVETSRGEAAGKPREKVVSVDEMLEITGPTRQTIE